MQFLWVFISLWTTHAWSAPPPACAEHLADDANFESLRDRIVLCGYKTVDEVIPILPAAHLSHYVLMHRSISTQSATFAAPRAILYGNDASLIVSFNGDPHETHNQNLEVLQYRSKSHQFEARDIAFANGAATFSDANPALCTACHHSEVRPNWETYPVWPGAYGGEDDQTFRNLGSNLIEGQDAAEFHQFLQNAKPQGRYRFLSARPVPELPNTNFGSALQKLNLDRISQKIANAPELHAYRYAMIGAISCDYADSVHEVADFIPPAVQTRFPKTIAEFRVDTAAANQTEFLARIADLQADLPNAPEVSKTQEFIDLDESLPAGFPGQVSDQRVASLRYLVENLGLSTTDWGMQPGGESYDFENGYVGIADLKPILTAALLPDTERSQAPSRLDAYCSWLQEKSFQALLPAGSFR